MYTMLILDQAIFYYVYSKFSMKHVLPLLDIF